LIGFNRNFAYDDFGDREDLMDNVRKIVPIIFGILILTGTSGFQFSPLTIQTAEAEPSKRIVGYFPWWESGVIDSIDYTQLTHINYFHIWPNADGSLDTTDINYDISNMHAVRDNAHSAGATISISVGGWGVSGDFSAMAASSSARATFVQNIVDFINTHNLDGVDIDWEPVDTETKKNNLAILLQDLGAALLPSGKLVTVAVNGERMELRSSAISSLSWVNVMAYDLNWNNAEHSTYNGAVAALDLYENEGIPKEKLVLGVPFYGRNDSWTSDIKYSQVVSSCSPAPSENYCNGYFFNGIDLITQKTQYVLDNGYGGVMIWNLGQDTYDSTSLLNAIDLVLGTSTPLPDMPPISNDQLVTTAEDTPKAITLTASDPNGDPLTYSVLSTPLNGDLTGISPNLTYTPDPGFTGTDSFTFSTNDGTNDSNTAIVSITVNPINDVSVSGFEVTTSGNKRWTGYVTVNVVSQDEVTPVNNASVSGTWSDGANGAGNCTTNDAGQCTVSKTTKNDLLTYTVDNISGSSISYSEAGHSVTFDSNGIPPGENLPPTADVGGPYSGTISDVISFSGSGSNDSDGTIVQYDWNFGDGNTASGMNPTHKYSADGSYAVSLTVTDDKGATDSSSTTSLISSQSGTELTISLISPNSMIKGQTISVTIFGGGFESDIMVKFEGSKWDPIAIITEVNESQIILDVTRSSAGPNRDFFYDVTFINSYGYSFTLPDSFRVNYQ
jgi:GH18 family chitinase/PKD repeat protein